MSHDPAAEFMSPYTYVHWDPVNGTDPSGACVDPVCALYVAIAVSVVVSAVDAAVNGTSPAQAVQNAAIGAVVGAVFQAGVIGPLSSAIADAAPVLTAAQIAYGTYGVVDGFRSGQGVQAAFGAVMLAFGLRNLVKDTVDGIEPTLGDSGTGQIPNGESSSSDGTWREFNECQAGDVGACIEVENKNAQDMEYAQTYLRQKYPEIFARLPDEPHVYWNNSERWANRQRGATGTLSGEITISRRYWTRADFIATLAHEYLHSGDGFWGRVWTGITDLPPGYGPRHTEIIAISGRIKSEYLLSQ